MKLIRKHSKIIASMLGLTFLFVSCSQNEDQVSGNARKYSGEDIFRGLFFFKNDIADGIPQLSQLKSKIQKTKKFDEIKESMNELSEISIEFINLHYPNFFNDLKFKICSGNLYEISIVLDKASQYIEEAGLSSEKFQSAFLMGRKINSDDNLKKQISGLDLSTSDGMNELKVIIEGLNATSITGKNTCITTAAVAALAVFYVAVAAVSIAVGAYSVYFKVAYWGPLEEKLPDEILTEFPDEFSLSDDGGRVRIEREVLIAQTSDFFSN
ncbi:MULTISPECIES: hypothetical protein [unclassified Flavobacterium]|uniref:hypothetical protein n=1 Tax=unclassified Flavobacterium TaxID=196869 RepID=UPI000F4FAA0C|nr:MULTISPECIES: hypothetical protein [unclassified Flavobacterium]